MPGPVRFLRLWAISVVVLGALVVVVNLVVDPYLVFGTPRLPGISALKPNARDHSMLSKTYAVARARPVTVLFGSSPTYLGFSAQDPAWPASMKPVFNYGIPGGYATSASLDTMREAIALGGVKNAIVFLDFQNFFIAEGPRTWWTENERRYRTQRDGTANPYRPLQVTADMTLSLLTMRALVDSADTVLRQFGRDTLNLADDGSTTESDFSNAARADGMHDLFAQKESFEIERVRRGLSRVRNWTGPLPNQDIVLDMIRLAKAHDVRLTLVILPHHAQALELYWRAGLWPRVEQLKAELADLVAREGSGVVLWDFLDFSSYNAEPVPSPGDRKTQTQWFWEPTHFKQTLGHIIIARITGAATPDFGAILTPANVAERNALVRAQQRVFACTSGYKPPAGFSGTVGDDCGTPAKQPS
ncbi:MAG: hypothetical protein U1E70_20100 [Acetobacteraceae bacterium]|nr:hypothetical protein [Pseudomonadota bacterium]